MHIFTATGAAGSRSMHKSEGEETEVRQISNPVN
jgi:hypothetical protein